MSPAASRIQGLSDRDESTMNYILQVIKGRSASTTLKLGDGVTSIGRHDDCAIRIKSSQVSRKHCELFEAGGKLAIRDLGSSNGTFVNGKKISGEQVLKSGDELTVGAVTLRVSRLGASTSEAPQPSAAPASMKASDTAVVTAVSVDAEPDDFEMELSDDEPQVELDLIPLDGEETVQPAAKKASAKKTLSPETVEHESAAGASAKPAKEDDAIAEFLLDLKLDDEE